MSAPTAAQIAADPDDYCTIDTCPLSLANFTYVPSLGGNVTYLAIFAAILIPQVYLGIRHKTWVSIDRERLEVKRTANN